MMVSGIPTASGYEERIRFSELEVVESGAIENGVLSTLPEGNFINGWDVNVAGVGVKSVKRNVRYHKHAVSYYWGVHDARTPLIILLKEFPSQSQAKGR
jgi:hypothetical protein